MSADQRASNSNPDSAIGVFDSGVGGLSVVRSLRELMPNESFLYVADQGHVPYGPRPLEQVRAFSEGITRYLLNQGAKIIVVACNSASAAALTYLRQVFPDVPFVGMEPAVKPAAERTETGVVGVLATPATFQGSLYASVVERFASGVTVLRSTCPGLVQRIEAGDLAGLETRQILRAALGPMLQQGIDTIVLACTHFPFVIPLIQEIAGERVRVLDPAPAVARQTQRLLEARQMRRQREDAGWIAFYTSGDPHALRQMLERLLGTGGEVNGLSWENDTRLVELSRAAARSSGARGQSSQGIARDKK